MGDAASAAMERRLDELARGVLVPLVLGGTMRLVRPIGSDLAMRIGEGRTLTDADLRSRVAVARVRRARLIAPIDTLPELDEADWALVAALNDLLQATNHELSSVVSRGRHARLLASVAALCERIEVPRTIGAALSRHATFARALEVVRTDRTVAWWTGAQASFRGQSPPKRLLAWPKLRKVTVDERRVPLAEMGAGLEALPLGRYLDGLSLWLGRTPLTDLATAARERPAFAWSASTLALVSTAPGRTLVLRALARQPADRVLGALRAATDAIPATSRDAKTIAESFTDEAMAAFASSARAG